MKILAVLLLSIVLLVGVIALQQKSISVTTSIGKKTEKLKNISFDTSGFVVLELFTSEGCSSCPAADKLLAQIIDEAERSGKHIYPIAFHVDYWNSLGWTDRFSSAEYSDRQSRYAEQFHLASIYTPQLIFNGRLECTGSDKTTVRKNIATLLEQTSSETKPQITISYDKQSLRNRFVAVDLEAQHYPSGAVLNVALIENHLSSNIKRGENSGRELHHENVVRSFRTSILTGSDYKGTITLEIPPDSNNEHLSVVAYIQEPSTLHIIGVAKL